MPPKVKQQNSQADQQETIGHIFAFIERVAGTITCSPSTQGPGPALFAPDRTGDQRRSLAATQILQYRDARKTFIEIEDANPQRPQQRLPQVPDYFHGLIPWQYESNRQGHSLSVGMRCFLTAYLFNDASRVGR
jgi:hypothetical protein